ncbi:MAG TPA: hypothetical protein VMX74_05700 [Pirellulales bacterium]|nr:hypothetical protein [Pirellulales bacterium]
MQAGATSRRNDIEDVLIENALGQGMFVGDKVFPPIASGEQDARFDKLAFAQIKTTSVDDLAASTSESNQVEHEYTTDNFKTVERRLKELVTYRDNALLKGFDAEVNVSAGLQYYMRLKQEKRVADIAFDVTTSFVSYTTAVTIPWSTSATATPVKDIQTAYQSLLDQINGRSDGARLVGIGNWQARIDLLASADVKNRWLYANGKGDMKDLTNQQIADVLGLDEVHFSRLQIDSAQIWNSDRFGIYMVSDNPMIKSAVRVGNTFYWTGNSPAMWNVESWENVDPDGTMIRVQTDSIEKLITARAGHVLTAVD